MDNADALDILEELDNSLDAYTESGGNLLGGYHVTDHEVVDGELLITIEDGRSFALKIEAV